MRKTKRGFLMNVSLLEVFAAMLESVGGAFGKLIETAGEAEDRLIAMLDKRTARRRKYGHELDGNPRLYALSAEKYFVDGHGSIRRRLPKRDKTMSARQWKKQQLMARAVANPGYRKHPMTAPAV